MIVHGYDGSKDMLYNLKSEAGKYKPKLLTKPSDQAFSSSVMTIVKDYKNRLITVDAEGRVRVQESTKVYQLKQECAGNSKKVLRFNKNKDKVYFISAADRSIVVEVDLSSNDFTSREKKFKEGKIIDFIVNQDQIEGFEMNELVTLNKSGWLEFKDLNKKERIPKRKLFGSETGSSKGSVNGDGKSMKTADEIMEEAENARFKIKGGSSVLDSV
jgi:hypothetical protein